MELVERSALGKQSSRHVVLFIVLHSVALATRSLRGALGMGPEASTLRTVQAALAELYLPERAEDARREILGALLPITGYVPRSGDVLRLAVEAGRDLLDVLRATIDRTEAEAFDGILNQLSTLAAHEDRAEALRDAILGREPRK